MPVGKKKDYGIRPGVGNSKRTKHRTATIHEIVMGLDPSRDTRSEDVYNFNSGDIVKTRHPKYPNALVKDSYQYILWPDGTYITFEGSTEVWWPYYIQDAIN